MKTTLSMEKGIIKVGKNGITCEQMMPAIYENLENIDNLTLLYKEYPILFAKSTKYSKVAIKKQIIAIMVNVDEAFEEKVEKKIEDFESVKQGIVIPGRQGVTNTRIRPAIESNIENYEVLTMLLNDFPERFFSCLRYTSPKNRELINIFIESLNDEQVNDEVLQFMDEYKSKNNQKVAEIIKEKPEVLELLSDEEKELVKLVLLDKSTIEIAKEFNLTKDQVYNKVFRNKTSIYNKIA